MTSRRACLMSLAAAAWPARALPVTGAAVTTPAPTPAPTPSRSTVAVPDGAPVRLVATEFPPYTGTALPGGGIACEITRAALRQAGLSMTLQFRPWARALLEFQRGEHDGVIGAWRSPERERTMWFPAPLGIVNQIGFMARAEARHRVDDLDRLGGLRIGTVNGYANPERFDRARLRVEPAVDDLANLRKLLARRIDLALIDKGVAAHLIDTQLREAAGRLVWLDPVITEFPLYTVFSRGRAEGDRFAAALTRGIGEMQGSGRLAELVRRGARWQ
ncbi:substrate-binding periplasmic protein [Roseateles amylovorans]|uniref:Transporter substrate-binding domain-containing protein n=1 Tax=Roseateles amylovorans TaxID=2978473 RepID=A0ABY6AZA6_9BURK|nr:transporter substrate-binding domain-containing protein [Roseateles amylovorans]UXH78511.1 transporter substrate-binding domain-containing protein [Roseateles amylovorans]